MILYFVASRDGYNGENADLFVWANDPKDAIILWRSYYELLSSDRPDRVWVVPTGAPRQAITVAWDHMEKISDDLLYRH